MVAVRRPRVSRLVAAGVVVTGLSLGASYLAAPHRAHSAAPPPVAQLAALTATLPVDPAVTVGRFDNGLRYYVRANKQPKDRAALRLVVNAGSVLEDDDQRGLAHLVEHLAFSGTTHFPKQDIAAFMQSIGMRFGPSVNAFTTFDETTFALEIPTDKPDVIDRALLILEDWAHNVSFDPAAIDKERGVVMEEWRLRQGAAARMQAEQFPVLLKGSRYAERLPIGTPESIQTFKPDRLRQFYLDWYRPDLMALVAVGDFDPRAIESLVRKHFASIPAPRAPRPRPAYLLPAQPGTLFGIATDKEASATIVSVYNKGTPRQEVTNGDYRRLIADRLFLGMLSARLSEAAQRPSGALLTAGAGRGRVVRSAEATILSATVKENGIDRGLFDLLLEAERVARFGFTSEEFDRQKTRTLRAMEQAMAEQANRPSATLAAEYIRNFTTHEPFPGLAAESDLTRRFVPEITLAEMNALAKTVVSDGNRVVLVNAPDRPGVTIPNEARIAAALRAAEGATVTPYASVTSTQPLIDTVPQPGTIAKVSTRRSLGITEWELSNGVRVVLKPTTFKDDEVLFQAFSPGGTSLAADADFVPAETAAQVVATAGVGKAASGDLRRILAGKLATVRPVIGPLDAGLAGGGSPKDLETLFQLIYLHFTQPRRDPAIFDTMTARMKGALANQTATPDFAFAAALAAALSQDHLRGRPPTPEMVDHMNLDRSLAFYKDRFADASNFTFVFVGNVTLETLRPLVERYLGSLPSLYRRETWRDVGIRPPTGVIEKRVEKGLEPKGRAAIVFTGPFGNDSARAMVLRAMADVLQGRLRETLREELSGTYDVAVTSTSSRIPIPEYSLLINFGSDPKRTEPLVTSLFDVIARLKADGPTATEVADVKAALLRDFETNSRQNGYLLGQIVQRYQLGEAPETLLDVRELCNKITGAAIQDAARQYLNTNNYVKVTLFPER